MVFSFTLIELLIVVAIIALLIALLLPALQRAKDQARVVTCLSNLKGQSMAVAKYAVDHRDHLPPRYVWWTRDPEVGVMPWLINRFLAQYDGEMWPPDVSGNPAFDHPTGIWHCPDVGVDNDGERNTHSGYLHYAPNRYLFNTAFWDDVNNEYWFASDVYPGWESTPAGNSWRQLSAIPHPSEVVSLIDNTRYFYTAHNHHECHESIGISCDTVYIDEADGVCGDEVGSHMTLAQRPAVFVDGHGRALPSSKSYWLDRTETYSNGGIPPGVALWDREVQRFMWFIKPGDVVNTNLSNE